MSLINNESNGPVSPHTAIIEHSAGGQCQLNKFHIVLMMSVDQF